GSGSYKKDSAVDWGFVAHGQAGANEWSIHYARGNLGGSPTVDSMQQWADTVNDSSYTFDAILPFFKKSVHFTEPSMRARAANAAPGYDSSAYDLNSGPLQVSFYNHVEPFSTWMNLRMQDIGIISTKDFSVGTLMGAQ
ncbi:hypothetical protein N7495_008786, partial [Penicillium taxi]|uniref:uncharacterized protein n=1 Tax=Penicillium taxi TaxID=168475 RepID=UPI002545A30B